MCASNFQSPNNSFDRCLSTTLEIACNDFKHNWIMSKTSVGHLQYNKTIQIYKHYVFETKKSQIDFIKTTFVFQNCNHKRAITFPVCS